MYIARRATIDTAAFEAAACPNPSRFQISPSCKQPLSGTRYPRSWGTMEVHSPAGPPGLYLPRPCPSISEGWKLAAKVRASRQRKLSKYDCRRCAGNIKDACRAGVPKTLRICYGYGSLQSTQRAEALFIQPPLVDQNV